MSYDLFFLRKASSPVPSRADYEGFFRSRANYAAEGEQFWYQNEDTGVYFSFDVDAGEDAVEVEADELEAPDDGLVSADLSFNMNYFRPHVFALEAEPELAALVEAFGLSVDDPQNEGMGRGAYSREGFLRSWNAGNAFGYAACLGRTAEGETPVAPPSLDTLPQSTLERVWRWNYGRNALQQELGDDVYVPTVRLVRYAGEPKSFIVWGDAIPMAIPEVDLVLMVREELAPRRLFRKAKDVCLVSLDALRPVLSLAVPRETRAPYHLFRYDVPPESLVTFFRSQAPFEDQLEGLSFDSVLTRELVDSVTARLRARRGEG